jgi:chemotaxis protein MotB
MSKKGGHHGGAWKVAYADFVTAMMALFMVLWLAAQDQKIKEAVERAFRHPFMSLTKESAGLMATKSEKLSSSGSGRLESAANASSQFALLRRLQNEMSKPFAKKSEDDQETVQFVMTAEGLRINIFDRAQKPLFVEDSPDLTVYGKWVMSTLAWQISRYDNFQVELDGHTELGIRPVREEYGGWELSADRANTGRRMLIRHGVDPRQIRKVAGYADTTPLPNTRPDDPINRRISLLLRVTSSDS